MKKTIALTLALVLSLSLTACTSSSSTLKSMIASSPTPNPIESLDAAEKEIYDALINSRGFSLDDYPFTLSKYDRLISVSDRVQWHGNLKWYGYYIRFKSHSDEYYLVTEETSSSIYRSYVGDIHNVGEAFYTYYNKNANSDSICKAVNTALKYHWEQVDDYERYVLGID
ncbi:MAG: hypothetical protein LBN43_01245 [Oscillospiraceae bacterium]|jgi:hypothetical protein|nr:hypothetical protein [Oscillospiraceae bacterium]